MSEQAKSQDVNSSRTRYESCIAKIQSQIADKNDVSNRFSKFRGAAFFAAIVSFVFGLTRDPQELIYYLVAMACFLVFIVLIAIHESVLQSISTLKHRRRHFHTQLARLDRDWEKLPVLEFEFPKHQRALINDLDLFGRASLFQLIDQTHTPLGTETIHDWILNPASPDEIRKRQAAARELSKQTEFLDELDLKGRLLASSHSGPKKFVAWAESERWLEKQPWLVWVVRFLTATILGSLVLLLTRLTPVEPTFIVLGVLLAVSLVVNVIWGGAVHEIFNQVDSSSNEVTHYGELFQMLESLPESEWLDELKVRMRSTPGEPNHLLHRLARIMRFGNLRRSAIFGIIHIGIQIVTLLDFYTLGRLEKWHREHGEKVRGWFEAVANLEAISSIATLVHDHPHWTFPGISDADSEKKITATSIGHPLLAQDACVRNDVQLGPTGTFLLVTGSNMSGKSTLLRSIGVNAMLAQMGAPVCAQEMSLSPVCVTTSMRIHDSLEDGVSFFMAELKRLKEVVDQSSESDGDSQRTLLFLLDEILQGTNSIERHIAVSRIVHKLVDNGAIGAVSTHDLELANSDELKRLCRTIHFRESFSSDGEMEFDYKIRDGLATTTNALKLLEMVGLGE